VIDAKQVRETPNGSFRVRTQSGRTIEQVLRRVIGGISDEGLWVDDEPGLPCLRDNERVKWYSFFEHQV
jgi:hypothetical protein